MRPNTSLNALLALVLSLALVACGEKTNDPDVVARLYWKALQEDDQTLVERLVVAEEAKTKGSVFTSETKIQGDKIQQVSFGETRYEDEVAFVPTTIMPKPEDSGRGDIGEVSFDTRLLKVDGEWKVDRKVTDANMMGAALAAAMGAMGEAFSEGMKQAVEGIGEAVSEGLGAMVEGLSEGLAEGLSQGLDTTNEAMGDAVEPLGAYVPPTVLPARVSGSIRGTTVELSSAGWSQNLAIYAGDGWGFNPSLLIFLFLGEGEEPAARTVTVNADDKSFNHPHVHYRWSDPQSGEIKTEVVTGAYDMVLTLGDRIGNRVLGEIEFSVPGEDTRVAGTFEIELVE